MNEELQAAIKKLEAMFQEAMLAALMQSDNKIPVNLGYSPLLMQAVIKTYKEFFPDYTITIEPQSEEDHKNRIAPKIIVSYPYIHLNLIVEE